MTAKIGDRRYDQTLIQIEVWGKLLAIITACIVTVLIIAIDDPYFILGIIIIPGYIYETWLTQQRFKNFTIGKREQLITPEDTPLTKRRGDLDTSRKLVNKGHTKVVFIISTLAMSYIAYIYLFS